MDIYIKELGATGDGKAVNTAILQKAIDDCHKTGGGRVIVSGGIYMTGSIEMRSNVDLHIASDGVLLASSECRDFPERENLKTVESASLPRQKNACIIFAEECENISITGNGKIDCSGESFVRKRQGSYTGWDYERIDADTPPRAVFFAGCRNVKVEDITVTNLPAGWCFWMHSCDYVSFDKVKIIANVNYPNNDGIHINCSRNVTISNCSIVCGDDCIIVRANSRSLKENRACERGVVTNCNLTSYSSGIRIGWMNDGVIKNCAFSNIVMTDTSTGISMYLPRLNLEKNDYTVADRGREATHIENMSFINIIMDKTAGRPIKIKIDDSEDVKCSAIKNIYFSNLHSNGPELPMICGRESCHVKNIVFDNCSFEVTDGREFDNLSTHGAAPQDKHSEPMCLKYIDGLSFTNTKLDINR